MKTGSAASPTAQAKATRTIGPNGLVRTYIAAETSEADIAAGKGRVYQVGEWRGVGQFRIHGESRQSFRQAFEAAGIYEANKGART